VGFLVEKKRFDSGHDYSHIAGMKVEAKTVSKGKLKAKMLEYFREVEASGEPLIVTDRGREVLEIRPVESKERKKTTAEVLAWYRSGGASKLPSAEEVMAPVPLEEWEVLREENSPESEGA